MDYRGDGGENVVHIVPGNEIWISGCEDEQAVWATDEDSRLCDNGAATSADILSNSNYEERQPRILSGSETPNKKTWNSQEVLASSNRSKAIGKMFFKTKLCCRFKAGTCPYITNCNFAHSIEELRRPPSNWQEIVDAHDEERGILSEPREEFQIPSIGSSNFVVETQRSYKGRHCKKFYTEEGCPYGDNCTFLHDEQSKYRESVAISLGPCGYSGGGGEGGGSGGSDVTVVTLKSSNWKTRICNKWEMTGFCPFGNKCHFAHGAAELHRYGGRLIDTETADSTSVPLDQKHCGMPSKLAADVIVPLSASVPHFDVYLGVPSQKSSIPSQRRTLLKWPNKISMIYGDWIDEVE